MTQIAIDSCRTEDEKNEIKKMTLEKLHDFGILCKVGRNSYPTHAFDFMTDNKNRFSKVQCAVFKGITRDIFIDQKEFNGPIYGQIEVAYQFVLRHINMGAEIEGIYRSDSYELPISAIREMIANAVTHRSYLHKSCIQVSVFDDRVEVLSPGMLYDGLDLETAKKGKSTCRNEAIAEAFHYMHIVEAWGTGIPRIINRCKEYGLSEPLFEEYGDGFKVTIFRKVSYGSEKVVNDLEKVVNDLEKVVNDPEKVVNDSEKVVNDPEKVVNDPEKVVNDPKKVVNGSEKMDSAFKKYIPILMDAGVTEKYVENMERVFMKCGAGVPFGQADVMEWLHCSKAKAINIMKAMKNAKIIRKVAGFGPGRYEFMEL